MLSAVFSRTDFHTHEGSVKGRNLKSYVRCHERKGRCDRRIFDTVMERENKTTTTIGNGVSLPHGSPAAVNESKVAIAILDEPVMWDDEPVEVVFLLGFKLITKDEINRIQLFYKEYVSLIDTDEKFSC